MATYNRIPALYHLILACYNFPSTLIFAPYTIASSQGSQQGDPLGGALYTLGGQKFTYSCTSPFKIAYTDDTTLGGPVENLISDYNPSLRLEPELGLHLNVAKCELITLESSVIIKFKAMVSARACHIRITSPTHAQLLGASITPHSGLSPPPESNSPPGSNLPPDSFSEKLEYHRHFVEQVNLLHPHDAFYLLKHVYGATKLTYSLRK